MKKHRGRIRAFITLAVMAAILAGAVWLYAGSPSINPDTFCPLNGKYSRTAVLVDATDSLNRKQIKEIKEHFKERLNQMRQKSKWYERMGLSRSYEWAGIFVLSENNLTVPKPIIALCQRTTSILTDNPERERRRYEKNFLAPMKSAIDKLADLPEQKESPIFEMIQAVALDSNFDSTKKRRLIIVSDMLQNTPEYSHYTGNMDYDKWRTTDYARDFLDSTLLRDVDVQILYVKRHNEEVKSLQTRRHPEFWRRYFEDVGAYLSLVIPI